MFLLLLPPSSLHSTTTYLLCREDTSIIVLCDYHDLASFLFDLLVCMISLFVHILLCCLFFALHDEFLEFLCSVWFSDDLVDFECDNASFGVYWL